MESEKKKFYRELGSKQINFEKPLNRDKIEIFWKKLWDSHKEINENAEWLKNEEARCDGLEEQEWNEITTAELKDALRKAPNWKSPGIDKVLDTTQSDLKHFQDFLYRHFKRS